VTLLLTGLGLLAAVLLLPTISDLISIVRLPFSHPHRAGSGEPGSQRLLFLIPAHNEELLLADCLESLGAQRFDRNRFDTLVIADNCTDRTAEIARSRGVRCLERQDSERRGKPWAIAWALERVDLNAYDGVVIVDADTTVDPEFARALAGEPGLRTRVLQAFNDVQNPTDNALTRMAGVHSMAIHGLSFRLKRRVGLNVPLGVGMCVGTSVLKEHGWPAFSVCEDWEMYALLTLKRVPTVPVHDAKIFAQEARSFSQSAPQRRRWMAGKLEVCARYAPGFLLKRSTSVVQRLDALAELTAVGPAVHLGVASLAAAAALLMGSRAGLVIGLLLLASLIRISCYTFLAVVRNSDPLRAAAAFLYLPIYAVWRLGIAATTFAGGSRKVWVRTARHRA
jgi:cellulose synthase/poly-beta-1,6-N-acetylglucosamine synthase-like glycosyltransferase